MGQAEGRVKLGDVMSKKECIRYLQDCQTTDIPAEPEILKMMEDKGYLEESKHLNKLYKQCQKN